MDSEIYQDFILEIYKNPFNYGKLDKPTLQAGSHNPLCGDNIEMFINTKENKISEIKFSGKGCAISQVSASLLTEHLKGMEISEAKSLSQKDILNLIKVDLSKNPSRLKCALLSLEVLKKAISKYSS
ncbi:SUF system NifU family Fe-S cluster assembly protein [Candidatus Micrarchaeota archaeon]|nr:SUF system NifU family Fe-S cluster assembly protein [Candidatus Micrarchaeota archaeon]